MERGIARRGDDMRTLRHHLVTQEGSRSRFALVALFGLVVPLVGASLAGCEGENSVVTAGDDATGDQNSTAGDANVPSDDAAGDDTSGDGGGNVASGDDGAGDDAGGDTAEDDPPALPQNEYCAAVEDWDAAWAQFEQDVLDLVNERRAAGADCDSEGDFAPAGPLTMNGALQCAARNHSMDMAVRGFFSHVNPDGDTPGERISASGYSPSGWGENIAGGYPTPESVVDGWMNSDGHCANIMNGNFTEIGVGYYEGAYWTLVFARPR